MTVEYDQEARALIKLLDGFPAFNQQYVSQLDKEIKGKGRTGANIIEKHFEIKNKSAGNMPALEDSTVKRKKGKPTKLVMSGTLKAQALKPKKPKITGSKVIMRAKVDQYGKWLSDGSIVNKEGKEKIYNFFNIFKNEMGLFNKMAQSVFDFLLLKQGVK